MQAPLSIRLRLIEAATSNQIDEIEQLHALDMALWNDSHAALTYAINQGEMAAVVHPWMILVDMPTSYKDKPALEHLHHASRDFYQRNSYGHSRGNTDDVNKLVWWWWALEADDRTWITRMVRQAPYLFLDLLAKHPDRLASHACTVHINLLHLVRDSQDMFPYDSIRNRKLLLSRALFAACACVAHPWQGVDARIRELCTFDTMTVREDLTSNLLRVFSAVNRHPGADECAALSTLLAFCDRNTNVDILLGPFCQYMQTVQRACMPTRILGDIDRSYTSCAAQYGSATTLEACLDHVAVIDTSLCDHVLGRMALNPAMNIESRALAHILTQLLPQASSAGVRSARDIVTGIDFRRPGGALWLFLIEYLMQHHGGSEIDPFIRRCDSTSLLWLLQRNPILFVPCLRKMTDLSKRQLAHAFFAQQARVRAALLLHTSLAADLVELVLQYV
jgi:hypothetical protein